MIASRSDLRAYLAADRTAHGVEQWSARFRLTRRTLYFQWLLRRAEYWRNCRPDPIGRLVYLALRTRVQLLGERLGFDIPLNVFGPGLHLPHLGSVVVNGRCRIGARCTVLPGVLVGDAAGRAPRLGDDVFLGPGSTVLGVDVGSRVGVRAGAVVVDGVPDGMSVGGIPARVIAPHEPVA